MRRRLLIAVSCVLLLTLSVRPALPSLAAAATHKVYLPLIARPLDCVTGESYSQGPVYQYDSDNPVRPAWNHADKNLALRSYTGDDGQPRQLVGIGGGHYDPTKPPQLDTLVSPARKFAITSTRSVYDWQWADSPNPGSRKATFYTNPAVTAAGLQVTQGELIRAPHSDYDLGQNVRSVVIYADSNRITLHYNRQDSSSQGYSIHIENVCVDPNLLALYNSLEGARNVWYGGNTGGLDYNLATLTANQGIGKASGSEIVVVVRDSGAWMDPRACRDWWRNYWNSDINNPICQ